MDPIEVGRAVVRGIRENLPHILSHGESATRFSRCSTRCRCIQPIMGYRRRYPRSNAADANCATACATFQ